MVSEWSNFIQKQAKLEIWKKHDRSNGRIIFYIYSSVAIKTCWYIFTKVFELYYFKGQTVQVCENCNSMDESSKNKLNLQKNSNQGYDIKMIRILCRSLAAHTEISSYWYK